MRSLSWKLGGALLLIVAISVGLTAYLVNINTASEFRQYVSAGNIMYTRSLAESLGEFYSGQQSWDNLQDSLKTVPLSSSQRIIVADNQGTVVGDSSGDVLGKKIEGLGLGGGVAITGSGRQIGTLYFLTSETTGMGMGRMMGRQAAANTVTGEEDFLEKVNDSLWKTGLIAAAAALVIGLVLTRQITRPVKALISGVRHLAKGELAYRVDVRSHDEIGELADSFNHMADSLEKMEQSRRRLTADIAHELRTPLTIIEGTVDGIIDGVFDADEEHLDSIREQTSRLTHLIGDLRDISLAESGQLKLNMAVTNINELVEQVVSRHEIQALKKNITFEMNRPENELEIRLDPLRIDQVISNLLTNAIRHTPPGGRITVSVSNRQTGVEISVADTGEGISPDDLPRIFERFYRSGTSRARSEGGTGLGLAIVKQMTEAHGGSVRVESKPGDGSTFVIDLPAA